MCEGIGISAELHGDLDDPRVTWLVGVDGGGRRDIVWPPGSTAQFTPNLVVLGVDGDVVATEGDFVNGGCLTSLPGDILLIPPNAIRPDPNG